MRRRQAYAVAQKEPALPPLPPKIVGRRAAKTVVKTTKGVCKKCGAYVGKGVGPHERFCKG